MGRYVNPFEETATAGGMQAYSQPETYAEKQQSSDGSSAAIQEANRVRAEKAARDKAAAEKVARDKAAADKQSLLQKAKDTIMRKGEHVSDPTSLTKDLWAEAGMAPTGQHKFRTQYERLKAKYGSGWEETTQAKEMRDYLSGVAVERGGGLGAFDPESGTAGAGIDISDPGESYRRGLLNQISSGRYGFGDLDLNIDLMRQGLSSDEYFKFRQQLMAADPSVGNVGYKEAFPFSSGSTLQGIAGLMPGMSTIKNIGKAANTMLGGVPGDILSAGKQMGTDLRTKAGDITGRPFKGLGQGISDWFKFNPPAEAYGNIGRTFAAAPSVRPDSDRGGVVDAAQSLVDRGGVSTDMDRSPYGGWIGSDPNQPRTADFIDSDGDGIDDRWQTGPGQPHQGVPGGDLIGPISPITLPQAPFSGQTDIAASQAAGYDIPIGGAQTPNFQDWYKNLGIMQNVYS